MRTLEPSRFQQVCAGDLVLLHKSGCALSNLPSLPHITVAGSVATATHGSGNANRSLAYGVTGMSLITGTGDQVLVDHHAPQFAGAVVHLRVGCLTPQP